MSDPIEPKVNLKPAREQLEGLKDEIGRWQRETSEAVKATVDAARAELRETNDAISATEAAVEDTAEEMGISLGTILSITNAGLDIVATFADEGGKANIAVIQSTIKSVQRIIRVYQTGTLGDIIGAAITELLTIIPLMERAREIEAESAAAAGGLRPVATEIAELKARLG
jgi:hypothetical protein